jgi:NAD+ diphosphatase
MPEFKERRAMGFVSSITPPAVDTEPAFWFVFQQDGLLVENVQSETVVPRSRDPSELGFEPVRSVYLGRLNGSHCYAAEVSPTATWNEPVSFVDLRRLHGLMAPDFLQAAVTGTQVLSWDRTFQYCGRCGTPTQDKADERAKICPACGLINFPRLSPAIIAAVIRDDQILLANGDGFPSGFFSVLAGFVEPGETLEACVVREVKEEVGIDVHNIRYFGSQPWPFPDSLMVAFTAEYSGGEIRVDGSEVKAADWFSANNLPSRPDARIDISGQLIEWFEHGRGRRDSDQGPGGSPFCSEPLSGQHGLPRPEKPRKK